MLVDRLPGSEGGKSCRCWRCLMGQVSIVGADEASRASSRYFGNLTCPCSKAASRHPTLLRL